uniref:Uncharacterized protein n=1 Tax=Tetranychus urticae TaxID=32264 RepID=T1K3X3_TETUR
MVSKLWQCAIRYSKPILQSRDAKSSSKEQESGVSAMESLHRQYLPIILRSMKVDVLKRIASQEDLTNTILFAMVDYTDFVKI